MGIISRVPWPVSNFKCGRLTQVHGRYVIVFCTRILVSVRARPDPEVDAVNNDWRFI